MRHFLPNIILILIILLTVAACKKGSIETNYNPSLQVANNQVIAERAYSQVFNIFFMVVSDSVLKATGSNNIFGAQCSYQDTNGIVYIIDYLDYYTSCPDGKVRKGKIIASLNKEFSEVGAIASMSFSNYVVDDLKLDGDNTISNSGLSMSMLQMYEYEVPSATLTLYDTVSHGNFHWESSKVFTWIEGMGTLADYEDDVFEITGTANGSDLSNVVYSAYIDEPLGNYFNCRWIRTGKTNISTPGLDVKSGYIDYIGEDTCTNQVIYYFNGNPFYDQFIKH